MLNRPSYQELEESIHLNRYGVVVAVAKGARLATDEYLEVRENAERMINNHETDKSLQALLGPEYKDQKPVKVAIQKLLDGDYLATEQGEGTTEDDAE